MHNFVYLAQRRSQEFSCELNFGGGACPPAPWLRHRRSCLDRYPLLYSYLSVSARLKWVLLMLQHWVHSRNRPTAAYENTRKVYSIYILAVNSLFGTISGKSLKLLPPDAYFKAKMEHQIRFQLGLHPRPRWASVYSALSDPL